MNKVFTIVGTVAMLFALVLPASCAQPKVKKEDPAQAQMRIINVRDYGAIADGKSHPMSKVFSKQSAIDAKYGKGKYALKDEADFVAINEAVLYAKKLALEHIKEGDYTLRPIYMPTGVYKVNRTIDLSCIYGLKLYGAGRDATRITFHEPGDLFYIDNAMNITFEDFSVESTPGSKSVAFHFHDTGGVGPTFKFFFNSIIFSRFYTGVLATGDRMTDSIDYLYCRFVNCLTGLHLQNDQSMVHNFFGCDFESYITDDSYYAPFSGADAAFIKAEAGGCVNVYGGSVIMRGTMLLMDPNRKISPNPINHNNGRFNFNGITLEQCPNSSKPMLFDMVGSEIVRARINIDSCRVYQRSGAWGNDLGILKNNTNVTLRNCDFMVINGQIPKIKLIIDKNTKDYWGSLTIDNSKWVDVYEERDPAVASMPNITHQVRVMNSAIHVDDHLSVGGPKMFNQMDHDITPMDIMASSRIKRIYYKEPTGTLSAETITLNIPKHGILAKIGVVKSSDETTGYTVTNASGSISFGQLNASSSKRVDTIDDIERLNDGVSWDGSIKLLKTAGGGSGYIFCEYY